MISYSDYYPFGQALPYRNGNTPEYRYGFNGMEKDDELKGNNNSYDFGARILDPRIGRWLSVDKRFKEYSCFSPYNFSLNNPVYYVDSDGNVIWDPVNKREVVVTFNASGNPTYLLDNGGAVSNTFMKQSIGILNSLATSNQGKEVIMEMMNVPTKVVLKEDLRPTPNGTINERASGIEPETNNKGETEFTKEGYFEEVTITVNTNFIGKQATKNNVSKDELLLGVMTVEIGHFSTVEQIQRQGEMQDAGFEKILSESEIPNLQAKTKANYEPLFNQAAFRQYLYRIEKNQLIDEGVSIIGQGAGRKSVNRAFETVNLMSTEEMGNTIKIIDALSKIKI